MDASAGLIRILHLEDDENDVILVRRELNLSGLHCQLFHVTTEQSFLAALGSHTFDLILSDSTIPDFDGRSALFAAREKQPHVPFVFLSGQYKGEDDVATLKRIGADDCIEKAHLGRLSQVIRTIIEGRIVPHQSGTHSRYLEGMEQLIQVVQDLSSVRDLDAVMRIVRRAARTLTGADGASFVLRERDMCFYADEDAIAPLWKGKRFPLTACVSGWTMLNREPAVIEDIFSDSRVPVDAYRQTFVKSLAVVPIRTQNPLGAIGNYWASHHTTTPHELRLLQALADTTAVAMENVNVYAELERRVRDRTMQLDILNKELEAFSYAVSHDLKAPLRHISGFATILAEEHSSSLADAGRQYLRRILDASARMTQITDDLLSLSRMTQVPVKREKTDLALIARDILSNLLSNDPHRNVETIVPESLSVSCDPGLLRIALENLLSNAWKFTSRKDSARIEVGSLSLPTGDVACFVRDNGAGFPMERAKKLFGVFQRMHSTEEFPGTGIGLATVQRIVQKHGGKVWAEAAVDKGATFFFTLA